MIKELTSRTRTILQTQGLLTLLKSSVIYIKQRVYESENYFLYEHTLKDNYDAEIRGLRLKGNIKDDLFHSNKEADALAELMRVDFRDYMLNARKALDNGAVALVLYSNGRVAHIGLMATTQQAKDSFNTIPFPVDFEAHQACSGRIYTVPAYRGQGLMIYGIFKRLQWMKSQGIVRTYNIIRCSNTASIRGYAHFMPRCVGLGRYTRVLWRKSWKLLSCSSYQLAEVP